MAKIDHKINMVVYQCDHVDAAVTLLNKSRDASELPAVFESLAPRHLVYFGNTTRLDQNDMLNIHVDIANSIQHLGIWWFQTWPS